LHPNPTRPPPRRVRGGRVRRAASSDARDRCACRTYPPRTGGSSPTSVSTGGLGPVEPSGDARVVRWGSPARDAIRVVSRVVGSAERLQPPWRRGGPLAQRISSHGKPCELAQHPFGSAVAFKASAERSTAGLEVRTRNRSRRSALSNTTAGQRMAPCRVVYCLRQIVALAEPATEQHEHRYPSSATEPAVCNEPNWSRARACRREDPVHPSVPARQDGAVRTRA
jgi:hypothetical protein